MPFVPAEAIGEGMILLLLVVGASADPAAPAPAPIAAGEEITVWGNAVEAARDAVVTEIEGLGYTHVRKRDDRTVFLADDGWKGKVIFYDDGRLATKRRGVSGREMEPIAGTRIRPYPLCLISPFSCVDAGSWYMSASKWRHNEDAVARATAAELVSLGDRLADASVAQSLAELPDRLDRLWTDGVPLEGTTVLPTWPARRAALLAFWDSRTETMWGEQVRDAVAAFVRAEVQSGEQAFSEAEKAAFDEVRRSSHPFPWQVE